MKVGLVAPFEGAAYRTGYDALFAARLALRDANTGAAYRFELVALDGGWRGGGAAARLDELSADPDVLGVVTVREGALTPGPSPALRARGDGGGWALTPGPSPALRARGDEGGHPPTSGPSPAERERGASEASGVSADPPGPSPAERERGASEASGVRARTRRAGLLPQIGFSPERPAPAIGRFSVGPEPEHFAEAIVLAGWRLGITRLAVLGTGLPAETIAALATAGRALQVVGQVPELRSISLTTEALGRPDGLLMVGMADGLALTYGALVRAGFVGPVLVVTPARADDWAPSLSLVPAVPVYWIRAEPDQAPADEFVARYRSLAGREPSAVGRLTYLAIQAIVQTAQQQAQPSRSAIAEALGRWESPSVEVRVDGVLPGGALGERIAVVPSRR